MFYKGETVIASQKIVKLQGVFGKCVLEGCVMEMTRREFAKGGLASLGFIGQKGTHFDNITVFDRGKNRGESRVMTVVEAVGSSCAV